MSVIEAALMRTAQASFGLLGVYLGQKHCMFNVDGGERGVLFQRFSIPFFGPQGVVPSAYLPGTYLMFPWLQEPTVIDVKARPKFEKAVTATKDLQSVNIGVRILHRPLLTGDKGRNGETMDNDKTLTELYRKFGVQYDERILPSIMNEVMKTTVAQYNAEELLTKREAVSQDIRKGLEERAETFGLKLWDVSITALTFGNEFAKAIEQKQVAEQDAERAKFVVQRTEQEKLSKIIRAEAEAEAAGLIQEAMKAGDGVIQLRKIEACKDIADTLAKSRNVVYIPGGGSGSNILLGVNAGQ